MATSSSDPDSVLRRTALNDLFSQGAIEFLAAAIDAACDANRPDALQHLASLADTIPRDSLAAGDSALLDYFMANLWSGLKSLNATHSHGGWEWECIEAERELICLRRAIRSKDFGSLPVYRVCQIHTNLGNCYNTIGRFVEAVDAWSDALAINTEFGMARANLAIGLWHYSQSLYDNGTAVIMAREAWRALDPDGLEGIEPYAIDSFARTRAEIEAAIPREAFAHDFDLNGASIGHTDAEIDYRRWCLDRRLFLHPLNDLGPYTIAARDILTAPSIVTSIGEGPQFHGFFNQIKQEYCSARWLSYESALASEPHFSDRDVLLYNTLDYPCYSLATEKAKLAFRALYSLFDKIAFFVNAYLGLGIPEDRVSFRSLWYAEQTRKKGIRSEFKARENWPLRGLFWLGKDLYEKNPEFRGVMDPDSERISEVRNHLEHKYLKLHDLMWAGPGSSKLFADDLAESVCRDEFERMNLRLLSLTRAAIVYLSLGVHREERLRSALRPKGKITPPMFLDRWDDEWKR